MDDNPTIDDIAAGNLTLKTLIEAAQHRYTPGDFFFYLRQYRKHRLIGNDLLKAFQSFKTTAAAGAKEFSTFFSTKARELSVR